MKAARSFFGLVPAFINSLTLWGCATCRDEIETVQVVLLGTMIKRECETSHLVYKYTHTHTLLQFPADAGLADFTAELLQMHAVVLKLGS